MSNQTPNNQSAAELKKTLAEKKDTLRVMRFKVAQRQLKKVHEVKKTKKEVARLLTSLRQKETEK